MDGQASHALMVVYRFGYKKTRSLHSRSHSSGCLIPSPMIPEVSCYLAKSTLVVMLRTYIDYSNCIILSLSLSTRYRYLSCISIS